MRFAITATDRYLGVFATLVKAGWDPVMVFTTPVDDRLFHNKATIDFARQLQIPVRLAPIAQRDFEALAGLGCEVLVVASYNHRIGDWTPYLNYAVNFHPSPLPIGRGPYPIVKAIRDRYPAWGVTCHKLSPEFDAGDILACEQFPLGEGECHDSLDLKIQMASKRLAANVAGRFAAMWNSAQPQVGGCYWKLWTESDRTINFGAGVEEILRQSRSFGAHETFVHLKAYRLRVRRMIGWTEAHCHEPGTPVHAYDNTVVIAVRDGYIALVEWVPDGAPEQTAMPMTAARADLAAHVHETVAARRNMPTHANAFAA